MKKEDTFISDFLQHEDIFKLYSRNSTVQIAENFGFFCMLELNKFRDLQFQQLMLGRDEFMDVYCRQDEFIKMEKVIETKLKKSKSIKDFFEKDGLPIFARYTAITNQLNKKYNNIKKLNNPELLKDYQTFAKINAEFIAFNFFIYLSDPVIDRILRKLLTKYLSDIGKPKQIQNYLVCISTPIKKPAVVEEHLALLKIIAKNKVNKKTLNAHREDWKWFPCYNPSDEPYDLNHYNNEIKSYTTVSAKEELKKIYNEQKKHSTDFSRLIRTTKDKDLKKLMQITNMVSYYRERRNDLRRQGLCAVRGLYETIGNKFGFTVKETCYLTNSEIQKFLQENLSSLTKKQIEGRFKNYSIFTDLKNNIFNDDKDVIKTICEQINNKEEKTTVIKGITAVKGRVQGVVRVVTSISVLKELKNGEILIASMTAPEYVPAMKRAAAVITDEGGITCHAAVISRELGVPCIVGTKIATKTFKNGDRVEVNTDTGEVQKI